MIEDKEVYIEMEWANTRPDRRMKCILVTSVIVTCLAAIVVVVLGAIILSMIMARDDSPALKQAAIMQGKQSKKLGLCKKDILNRK